MEDAYCFVSIKFELFPWLSVCVVSILVVCVRQRLLERKLLLKPFLLRSVFP